jgi:TPR repeat protein
MGRLSSTSSLRIAALAIVLSCMSFVFYFSGPAHADPTEPEDTLIARCTQGVASACLDVGLKDTNGTGKPINLSRGLSYFEKGCDLGNMRSCALAAYGHYNAKGTPVRDLMKAINYGTKACEGNDAKGCYDLGLVYKNATGLPNYAQRSAELFRKSCALDPALGCASSSNPSGGSIVSQPAFDRSVCTKPQISGRDYLRCSHEAKPKRACCRFPRFCCLHGHSP